MELFSKVPIIPVLRKIPYDKSEAIIQSLIDGGIKVIEITMDTDNAVEMIRETKLKYGAEILVGAGTVMSQVDCDQAIEAGAEFIVSPHFDVNLTKYAVSLGLLVVPGVFTPSEMVQATQSGAKMVKVFPSSVLGPQFIKDVKGPLSKLSIMCTGGITKETAKSYLQAGAIAIGAGGSLIKSSFIESNDWKSLTAEVTEWLDAVK